MDHATVIRRFASRVCFAPLEGGFLQVVLAGALEEEAVAALHDEVVARIPRRLTAIAVDLDLVTEMDTAGVALIVELIREARRRRATIRLSHAGPGVRGLLRLFRLDSMIER